MYYLTDLLKRIIGASWNITRIITCNLRRSPLSLKYYCHIPFLENSVIYESDCFFFLKKTMRLQPKIVHVQTFPYITYWKTSIHSVTYFLHWWDWKLQTFSGWSYKIQIDWINLSTDQLLAAITQCTLENFYHAKCLISYLSLS